MFQSNTNLSDYLACNEVIDWQHLQIRETARNLTAHLESAAEKAHVLFDWVRDEIPHTRDIGDNIVTCSASEVLSKGTGICYAKSHLLAALLRAEDIPAGFCYQKLRKDPPFMGYELHGFNAIFLSNLKRWIRVDARGNKPGVDAQFGLDSEQLAFSVDEQLGEQTYPSIYAEPAPVVVRALQRSTQLDDLWFRLPSSLD